MSNIDQTKLTPKIETLYIQYKKHRNFSVVDWVENKIKKVSDYMTSNGITAVVLGVSGGVDSAIVHALLQKAAELNGGFRVYPYTIPIKNSNGTTGQTLATYNANKLKINPLVSDSVKVIESNNSYVLEMMFNNIQDVVLKSESLNANDVNSTFAKGQLDYYIRPMYLYGVAAMMNAIGHRAIVCGTINKTEASIGFFGKKTDTCDIQIISDIYKSEVYQVAEYLDIHKSIINSAPVGGLHTAYTDEVCIGAPYRFIEMYLEGYVPNDVCSAKVEKWKTNIDSKINENSHKFSILKNSTLESIVI